MDTMLPSEGSGTGSIPVEDTLCKNNPRHMAGGGFALKSTKFIYSVCSFCLLISEVA